MRAQPGALTDLLVLFDWNGTLMADRDRAAEATNDVLRTYRLPELAEDEFRRRFRLPLAELIADLGVPHEYREAAQLQWNAGLVGRPAPLRPEAPDVLEELVARGAVTGVVSAAGEASVLADMDRSGEDGARVRQCLRILVADAQDKVRHLLEHRVGRPRAAYVGDTDYDVRCARRAGYLAVAVAGGYQHRGRLRTVRPDAVVDSLAELPALLAGQHAWVHRTEPGSIPSCNGDGCQ